MEIRRSRTALTTGLLGLFGLLAAALTNCTTDGAGTAAVSTSSAAAPAYASAAPSDLPQDAVTAATQAPAHAGDYRISARDILEIQVFQVPDLNKTVQVNEDGTITLPLVGKISFAGLTIEQAQNSLADKLKRKYLQSPQVSIFVKQFGQRVTVSGEVKTPKVLAVDGAVTLTQAIANAGGVSDLADSGRIHVARSRGGHVSDTIYNLDDIQAGKKVDPILEGGDIVVAEQSGTRVVLKNVKDLLPFAVLSSIL